MCINIYIVQYKYIYIVQYIYTYIYVYIYGERMREKNETQYNENIS